MAILAADGNALALENAQQQPENRDESPRNSVLDESGEVFTPVAEQWLEQQTPSLQQASDVSDAAEHEDELPTASLDAPNEATAPVEAEFAAVPLEAALIDAAEFLPEQKNLLDETYLLDWQVIDPSAKNTWDLHALTSFQLMENTTPASVITELDDEFWQVVTQEVQPADDFALTDDQVLTTDEAEKEKVLLDAVDAALWQKELVQEEPDLDMSLIYLQAEQRRQRKHWLERGHDVVSRIVKGVGRSTDRFLSRRLDVDDNETYVRVRVAQVFERGGEVYWQQDIKAKVDLPTTRDKLQLILDNDPDDIYTLPNQHNPVERARDGKRAVDENSTAALRWIAPMWHSWRPSLDVGIRAKVPLDPFIRIRFRRDFDFSKNWDLRVGQQFSYTHSRAAGSDTDFTFLRLVTPDVLITHAFDIRWRGKTDSLEYGLVSSITYTVTDADTLLWQLGAFYEEKPDPHLDSYMAGFTYRRKIRWEWLHAEFTPGIVWKEKYDFRDDHSFTARLEVVF